MLIEFALATMRDAIATKKWEFIEREKNMATLAQLGIMPSHAIEEMEELTARKNE